MTKIIRQPLMWAWALVFLWGLQTGHAFFTDRWVGLIISLAGLVSALLIASAVQRRGRKGLYPKGNLPSKA